MLSPELLFFYRSFKEMPSIAARAHFCQALKGSFGLPLIRSVFWATAWFFRCQMMLWWWLKISLKSVSYLRGRNFIRFWPQKTLLDSAQLNSCVILHALVESQLKKDPSSLTGTFEIKRDTAHHSQWGKMLKNFQMGPWSPKIAKFTHWRQRVATETYMAPRCLDNKTGFFGALRPTVQSARLGQKVTKRGPKLSN